MLTKARDFYFGHKLLVNLIVSIVLIFLSSFWFPFMYMLIAFLLVSYWTLSTNEIISLTMFLMMFSGMILLFVVSAVYTFIVILAKYIIDIKNKKAVILKVPLILTTAISVVFMTICYKTDVYSIFQGLLIVMLMFFFYVAVANKDNIHLYGCFKHLLYGMIAASLLGLFFYLVPACKTLAYTNWEIKMMSIKDMMFHFDRGTFRLSLLSFHINHLAVIMLVAAAYAVNSLLTRKGKKDKDLIFLSLLFMFAMGIGALTLSKTFIVGASFILLVGIVGGIAKYKLKSLKVILPILVILGGLTAIFHEKVFQVFQRFLGYNFKSILSSITTGRDYIWKLYFDDMITHPLKLVFGAGLCTSEVVAIGPHSGYVFMFYRFGIVGTIAILGLAVSYYVSLRKNYKFNIFKLLPLVMILMVSFIEACFDERFFFFVLAFLFFIEKRKPKTEEVIQEPVQVQSEDIEQIENSKQKKSVTKSKKHNTINWLNHIKILK